MKKFVALGILAVAGVVGTWGTWGLLQAQQPNDTGAFMQIKLQHAQKIVEGLALENYDLIGKSAQKLALMSHESNWNVLQTVEYNRLSREFRDSTHRLHKAANEKNLDGATLAYFEVTLNCVRCHKYERLSEK